MSCSAYLSNRQVVHTLVRYMFFPCGKGRQVHAGETAKKMVSLLLLSYMCYHYYFVIIQIYMLR